MEELLKKNQEAQSMIELLKSQIEVLKNKGLDVANSEDTRKAIMKENQELAQKIIVAKAKLLKSELLNGDIQVELPVVKNQNLAKPKSETITTTMENVPKTNDKVEVPKQDSKGKVDRPKATQSKSGDTAEVIDVSRFDMRIGKIIEVSKHPEADTLYVEKVDVGESKPRQIISGLVNYCNESDLLGRMGIFLLNLKPAKMRGIMSEGMIMCASAPDQGIVEPLIVPGNVKPGDRVTVDGYGSQPDDVMNPKKKILETVKPDLQVNMDGVATYRGAPWVVNGEVGVIVSSKLKNVPIA